MVRCARWVFGASLAFCLLMPALALERNDVLVIVNDNSHDSPLIAKYYAEKRNVIPANVVHISTPNQYYIDWTQFIDLRDQILRKGICSTVAPGSRPIACSDTSQPIYTQGNIDTLTTLTPIKYIVTTRGVPSKVNTYLLSGDSQTTSVDNYLRIWLAGYYQGFTGPPMKREGFFDDGRGMRVIDPALDKEYIVGRIDGVDLTSATALVDRAIRTERNGLYGNLFASTFGSIKGGSFQWTNYKTQQPIYMTSDGSPNYWRYAFGPFGERRPECANYAYNYLSVADETSMSAKSPAHCLVQFNKGNPNEAGPGVSYSRQPLAVNAMAYFGSLDGQTIIGGFSSLLNWRKTNTTCMPKCKDASDPKVCKANSTDPYKEINTDCVGVADGFIGYNFQSYPLSIFGIWPTGWQAVNIDYNDTPSIRNNDGQDDSYSVWFANRDDVSGSSQQRIGIQQLIYFATPPTTTKSYRLSFYAKGENSASQAQFSNGVQATYYPDGSATNPECPSGPRYVLVEGRCIYTDRTNSYASLSWSSAPIVRDITVPAIVGWKNSFIAIQLGSGEQLPAGGALGFDNVSLKNIDGTNTELAVNGSFNQGHMQTSPGDFAANFLSRLGGTAFWGSLSHHGSGGHSFDSGSLGSLVYFMRGLPLGDAVWLGDKFISGDLYGDPLYSPLSVRVNNPNNWDFIPQGVFNVIGSALNGHDATVVLTSYSIEYCVGSDFFVCDTDNSWVPTGVSGAGPVRNASLGNWNTANLRTGQYLIRLSVTSSNSSIKKQQTFHDYLPVTVYSSTSDFDGDGAPDTVELSRGSSPVLKSTTDSDGDSLTDDQETYVYRTNPTISDSDGDGLTDGQEVSITYTDPLNKFSVNPNVLDANLDPFLDGVGYRTKLICGLDVMKSQQGLDTDTDGMGDLAECLKERNPFVNEPALVPNILRMMGF